MGNPFVHLDLSTTDPAAAKKFYGAVFDWKFQDFPQMNWTGIDVGAGVGGGLGPKQDPQQPTSWTAYVSVDDVRATMTKAAENGAIVVVPHMEVPGMGWLGVFVDPQGGTIGVWQSATPPPAPKPEKKRVVARPAAARKPAAKKAAPTKAKAKPAAKTKAKAKAKKK
jgi:predicted enzyme related to lactoylglutathione lyase